MANVKLEIEINPNYSNNTLGQISTDNMDFANTSIKPNADSVLAFPNLSNAPSETNSLTYGQELCFNDFDVLDNIDGFGAGLDDEDNPVEVVWGIVNGDKSYNVTLNFTGATELQNIIVYGDKESKQFPTRAILDGTKEVFSDDYVWIIKFDNPSDTHTIQFTHWNRANYNAVITLIDVAFQNYEVDIYNGLKSVESLSQSSADTTGIFYGSIESSGSAELLDKNGELEDLLRDGVIDNSNVPITIFVNGKEVQKHISTDSSYDRNSKMLSIELGNRLNTLDVLKYKGYNYPDHSENLANLLFDVLSSLRYALFGENRELTEKELKEMLSAKYNATGATLYEYLTWLEVEYPFIEANKTYREVLDEFCLIAQMQMYIDDNNNVRFISARPIITDTNFQAIHIPKKNMFSQLDYSIILKNKYGGVEASKTNVNDVIDYETIIGSFSDSSLSDINNDSKSDQYIDISTPESSMVENQKQTTASYAYVENIYTSGQVIIKKKTNQNLDQILKFYTGTYNSDGETKNYIRHSVRYKEERGTATRTYTPATSSWNDLTYLINPDLTKEITDVVSSASVKMINSNAIDIYDSNKKEVSLTDKTNLSTVEYSINKDGDFVIDYTVLIGKKEVNIYGKSDIGYDTGLPATATGDIKITTPLELEITFYGDKRTISFEQIQSNTENIEAVKTKVSLGSSNLIQNDYAIETIKTNIMEDYKQGISNASVSISCNDYFDSNGKKIIDWSKGEIPHVNQIIYFDNDLYKDLTQRYWKIKGRNFRKTGVPMVDLELEEIKESTILGDFRLKYVFNSDIDGYTVQANVPKTTIRASQITGDIIILPQYNDGINGLKDVKEIYHDNYGSNLYGGGFEWSDIKSINIPDNIEKINLWSFLGCSYLTDVTFSENSKLKYLRSESFKSCSLLKNINLPLGVTYLGSGCFYNCESLTQIRIPTSIDTLEEETFEFCSSLKTIFIPKNIQNIPDTIFIGCNSSLVIYCETESKPSNWNTDWNTYWYDKYLTVKWGYTYEQYMAETGNI